MPQCYLVTMLLLRGASITQADGQHDLYFILTVLFGRVSKSERQQSLINRVPS